MIHVETDLRGDAYRRLMGFCFSRSDAVSLTCDNTGLPFKRNIRDLRRRLRPWRLSTSSNLRKRGKEYDPWSSETADDRYFRADHVRQFIEDMYAPSEEVRAYICSAEGIGDWAYPQRPVDVRFFHAGRAWAECGTDEGTFYCCIRDHQREARLLLNALNANYSWER